MDSKYFILLPLFLVGLLGFVAVVIPEGSLISSAELQAELKLSGMDGILYDSGGHGMCYYNTSKVVGGEDGIVRFTPLGDAEWLNVTGSFRLYMDDGGRFPLSRNSFGVNGFEGDQFMRGFALSGDSFIGSLWVNMMAGAFVAIVIGAVAGAAVLSVTVLGSGEKEYGVKVIVTVGFYSLLWVLVSAVGVSLLVSIPFFGFVFYGLLSFAYYLGVWGEINN